MVCTGTCYSLSSPCIFYCRSHLCFRQSGFGTEIFRSTGKKVGSLYSSICFRNNTCSMLLHYPSFIFKHPQKRRRAWSGNCLFILGTRNKYPGNNSYCKDPWI
jgi:hypothetical protein